MKMNQEKNQLFEEFNRELWLFLDKDLSEARMKFWEDKIAKTPELKKYLIEYQDISKIYNSEKIELGADKFNEMIDNAISIKSNRWSIRNIVSIIFSTERELAFGKIAFASVLIIGAIVISLVSNKKSPVIKITENISSEILDWDADYVDKHINKLGNLLKIAGDEDFRKYYKYKLNSKDVDKNITQINATLKELKEDINSKKL